MPKIDSHQDWTLIEAKENETTTYLKFSRLVNTCDKDEDYPISVKKSDIKTEKKTLVHEFKFFFDMKKGTNRVIWAIGPIDDLVKHSSIADRGTRSVSFLDKRTKFNESEYATICCLFLL